MASQRLPHPSAQRTHLVHNAAGEFLNALGNKSAASRWVNEQTKAGADTAGWTIRPAPPRETK
jgi:hypothetical protein